MTTTTSDLYQHFLSAITRKQWERIGLVRRAGVCTPLFSVYSRKSIGLGELPDLKLLVDWCQKTRMSILQLLPMNDTGFNFRPYDAQSTFALDPMYLSLESLVGCDAEAFRKDIEKLRTQFPPGQARVNYGVKKAKLEVLWKIFYTKKTMSSPNVSVGDPRSGDLRLKSCGDDEKFDQFLINNHFWLEDYALFKVIKEQQQEAGWEDWAPELRDKNPEALHKVAAERQNRMQFHRWLQWQLDEQFSDVKQYARRKKVFLMGDLPFLVARDSADVWSRQPYFKLDLSSGAPPDAFFAMGQRWGMPPYNWPAMEGHHFDYFIDKIRYAEHFYDMFRIDHVVGTFRLWTTSRSEPAETFGLNGLFDPPEERDWEAHGRKLLSMMVENTDMLPCAEDLGVVPECSYRTLWDLAIPGMEVQRWTKEWHTDFSFKLPEHYRPNAMAVISNHDTSPFYGWWVFEAGTVDEELFRRLCREKGMDFDALKPQLFDLARSQHHRLRWKSEIRDLNSFLGILNRPQDQVGDLIEMYRGSYDEKNHFWHYLGLPGEAEEAPSSRLLKAALEKASLSASIFSLQLLQDWLDLGPLFPHDAWEFRINFPGTSGPHNWSLVIPLSLEEILECRVNDEIKKINELGDRV